MLKRVKSLFKGDISPLDLFCIDDDRLWEDMNKIDTKETAKIERALH